MSAVALAPMSASSRSKVFWYPEIVDSERLPMVSR